jgi:hypothetical protein
MKNVFLFLATIIFASYGSSQTTKTNVTTQDSTIHKKSTVAILDLKIPDLPTDYVKLDLSNIGLNATAMAPQDADMQKSYLDDNEGGRDYYLFLPFRILTGDSSRDVYGGIWAQIEILTTTWTLQQHKDRIKYSSISGWHKFLLEDPDYFIYSAAPANSWNQPIRSKDKDVYNFVMLKKSKNNGKQYCIRSSSSIDLTKDQMLQLLAIAKSIEL